MTITDFHLDEGIGQNKLPKLITTYTRRPTQVLSAYHGNLFLKKDPARLLDNFSNIVTPLKHLLRQTAISLNLHSYYFILETVLVSVALPGCPGRGHGILARKASLEDAITDKYISQ